MVLQPQHLALQQVDVGYQDNPHIKNEPTNAPSRFGKMIFLDFWYVWLVKEGFGKMMFLKIFGMRLVRFFGGSDFFSRLFFTTRVAPANGEVSKFEKLKAARLG